ncbi:MAG: bifunctional folylpolyglutamate synthase/dihydrofolate synthase [Candidatus Margulisbacteria bacterium]|jgi:dihydrofolate synthase/folylpolyglutamate synthase|nr:bifunctional folylpolyglutamate synthase/dihydrofolate synthase [Candidatus Margulisiibacteriota bacterium]
MLKYFWAVRKLERYARLAGVKPGLARITKLLDLLGRPQRNIKAVHIAGTNGKGSTALLAANALRECGYKAGTYLSPHLVEYTERFLINGQEISRRDFARIFWRVAQAARRVKGITEFEILTAMAFVFFQEQKVDLAVLETGLGGKYDATNVCRSILTIITPVDYDHEAVLGTSLKKIAAEKAGIIKKGVPLATVRQKPEVMAVIKKRAAQCGCQVKTLQAASLSSADNKQLVLTALRFLKLPPELIKQGLQKTIFPGRQQKWLNAPPFYLDVAHNPQAFASLLRTVRPKILVFGLMRRKNLKKILAVLQARIVLLIAVTLPSSRREEAFTAAELAAAARACGIPAVISPDVPSACRLAAREALRRRVTAAAAGSFHLVGAIFKRYKLPRAIC